MKLDYWRVPELRAALVDGVAVAMGPRLLAAVALGGAALFALISWPVWFLGRCVFVDSYPVTSCVPYPSYGVTEWSLYVLGRIAMSSLYAALHWGTLRLGLTLRSSWGTLYATTPFGLICGWLLGRSWALAFTDSGYLSAFGELAWGFTVPATLWLLGLHFRWWATAKARYYTEGDERIEHIVRMLVCRYLHIAMPTAVRVRCDNRQLTIVAPVDAVDARRIEDIVLTRFPDRFSVAVQSTLSDDQYWAIYRSQLGPSGYTSPALRPPRGVPMPYVAGILIVGLVLIVLAFWQGPGLAPGIRPEDIQAFFGVAAP